MKSKSARSILIQESVGFAVLILCIWIAEWIGLPHLLFGDTAGFQFKRVLLRSALILIIWGGVHFRTRRLLRRLGELEGFLLVCSWCRKVGHEEQWMTMEDYFGSHFATETSHGICPECAGRHLGVGPHVTRVATNPPVKRDGSG